MTGVHEPWEARLHAPLVGALYVHVPFCIRRCAYCDFATAAVAREDPLVAAYLAALRSQLDELARAGLLGACTTAYVGGGTPTHVGGDALSRLVGSIAASTPRMRELSCEANPESLSGSMAMLLARAGVTRVSVGVQSLNDAELVELGRAHDAARARASVIAALDAGLDASVDLMCATPLQTDRSWDETLDRALCLGVGHVSVYPLSIEEGTPLARTVGEAGGRAAWNDPEVQASRMERAAELLEDAGLDRYEVASYAVAGKACEHNIAYWSAIPYLGLGTRSASMLTAEAFDMLRASCLPQLPKRPRNVVRVRMVVESSASEIARDGRLSTMRVALELLDERQAAAEDLMLGVRMVAGSPPGLLGHARSLMGGELDAAIETVVRRGLASNVSDRLVPTVLGWLRGNELYGELWSLAGASVRQASVDPGA